MSSDSQRDLTFGMLKVNSSALGGELSQGGRVVEPRRTELSLVGNKGTCQRHLPHPFPQPKSQRDPVPIMNLLAPPKHPMLCFCGSILRGVCLPPGATEPLLKQTTEGKVS